MHMELLMTVLEQCKLHLPFLSWQLLVVTFDHDNNYLPKNRRKEKTRMIYGFVRLILLFFYTVVSHFFARVGQVLEKVHFLNLLLIRISESGF